MIIHIHVWGQHKCDSFVKFGARLCLFLCVYKWGGTPTLGGNVNLIFLKGSILKCACIKIDKKYYTCLVDILFGEWFWSFSSLSFPFLSTEKKNFNIHHQKMLIRRHVSRKIVGFCKDKSMDDSPPLNKLDWISEWNTWMIQ